MDERIVFSRVNSMLAEADYPLEIKDIADLEDFLNDAGNASMGLYDEIEQLYNQLLGYEDTAEDF
ncbi:MAG: hypothetical protein N3I35_07665 [Clostridia bacterium]|nr:hypothetical protein [Clostridia bacterium]